MGCFEIKMFAKLTMTPYGLTLTWDVLKSISHCCHRFRIMINFNMGCFEITANLFMYEWCKINFNMGCFEIANLDGQPKIMRQINFNMGCFEIFCRACIYVSGF